MMYVKGEEFLSVTNDRFLSASQIIDWQCFFSFSS
jgi:hypothetical protein